MSAYQYSDWTNRFSCSRSVKLWTNIAFFHPNEENKEIVPKMENIEKRGKNAWNDDFAKNI